MRTETPARGPHILGVMEPVSSIRPLAVPNAVSRTVTSFDGTEIHYDLYDSTSRNVVLIIPGFWRERRHETMVLLGSLLNDAGYRAAVCDLRGHGTSGGTFGFNRFEHHDVAAIVEDLRRHDQIDRVVLLGLSYGGAIAISAAARHELQVAAVILISAVADFEMLAPRFNPLTIHRHIKWKLAFRRPRFAWRMRSAPKLRALDDVANVHAPICLIHVKNDWLVGHRHSVALYERANEPKDLHVMDIEGNYHADRLLSVAWTDVQEIVTSFLRRHV